MCPKRETLQYGCDFDSSECHQKPLWVLVSVFPSKKTIIVNDLMNGCIFKVLMKILKIFEKRFQKNTEHVFIGGEKSLKDKKSIPLQSYFSTAECFFANWQNAFPVKVSLTSTKRKCQQFGFK